jgi:hypothetical protein
MGIIAYCPRGHRMKVKDQLAGRKGICPECGTRFRIPQESQSGPSAGSATAPAASSGEPAGSPPATSSSGLPVGRIVSLDPDLAATLPRVLPLAAGPGDA